MDINNLYISTDEALRRFCQRENVNHLDVCKDINNVMWLRGINAGDAPMYLVAWVLTAKDVMEIIGQKS